MSNILSIPLSKYVGLSLVSACVLALQVVFTRVFSIMIWYHFAYMVIGVALLGGGAAGTYMAIRQWNVTTIERNIGRFALAFSFSILISLAVIVLIHFDPLGGISDAIPTLIGLGAYFISLFFTFLLGGLTIVSAFSLWVKEAHRLYFADLLGASIGALLVTWVIWTFTGPGAIVLVSILALIAALVFRVKVGRYTTPLVIVAGLIEVGLFVSISFVRPIQLPVPHSKELGRVMSDFDIAEPEFTSWNPVARVDVLPTIEVDLPWIVGGISSAQNTTENLDKGAAKYQQKVITYDGTSMTAMLQFDGDLSRFRFLDNTIISAPYQVSVEQPSVLDIGVGGGLDIILARLYNAKRITAIELNTDVVNLLKGRYADFTGGLADDPRTTVIAAEGRSFLTRDDAQYDVIQGIGLDNFAALSGGAYVLSEAYLYTVDAVETAINRLAPGGVFAWTRTTNNPPREMLRLTGLAAEALRRQGVSEPGEHIAIVANEAEEYATLLISRSPFTTDAIQKLRDWSTLNHFKLLLDPFERLDTAYADYVYASDPRAFEAAYAFNIFPTTDDNPFFFNYFKWSHLEFRQGDVGDINLRFPIGNLILLMLFGFSVITASIFILLPLMRYRRGGLKTPYAMHMLSYFSLLGLGYIFIEIVLIQRFTLFIGYPTLAITTAIFSMLLFSALGSLVGRRICTTYQRLRLVLLVLAVLLFAYIVGLPVVFRPLLLLPDLSRLFLSVVFIAPLAFLMGMPFPTGLNRLGIEASSLVPWAWGMNGVFSVLGSVLVIIVSIQTSFSVALACSAVFYLAAAFVSSSLWKVKIVKKTLDTFTANPVPTLSNIQP